MRTGERARGWTKGQYLLGARLFLFHPMQILWTLLVGLVVGAVAKLIMPGKAPGGIVVTMLIGLAGSFVATFVGRVLRWYQPGQEAGFIASVLGAILLLWLYRAYLMRSLRR
jgi:uncharacterized membrane protein YeaQ/YmgE (transglycosylase-associated protein family)